MRAPVEPVLILKDSRFGLNAFILKAELLALVITLHVVPFAKAQPSWSVRFDGFSTFSSPRVADLNGDGTGDIVFGAGRAEFHKCDSAVIALDGLTGKMLWHVRADDQIFGSASFIDINGDHVDDVFIGGRSASLFALNGKNGEVIWKFGRKKGRQKWFNFYNPQFVGDLDHDGLPDILISNGGNVMAAPYETKDRHPGNLVLISSRDGTLLSKASMPDNKETYMSVSAYPLPDGSDYQVIFGTGGETVGGSLYVTYVSDILKGDLTHAHLLDSSPSKGYIGPAAWVDISGDSYPDIIANAVEGKLSAFNGRTYEPLWSVKVPNSEAYSSIAPGYFNTDSVPDFFVSYAIGIWPKLEFCKQILVDGATGKVAWVDSLGFYQTSTPVVADLDGNGRDEALLSVNVKIFDERNSGALYNIIATLDFTDNELNQFSDPIKGSNISSTPWIGDLDHDNFLDIIYCHGTNPQKTYTFDGMQIHRIATKIPVRGEIRWGSYMGSHYNGVYIQPSAIQAPR